MTNGRKAQTIAVIGIILALIVIGLLIYIVLKPTTTGEVIKEKETIIRESITCNSPYIKVGNSCCLDRNENDICDNEEATPLSFQPAICVLNAPFGCDEYSISSSNIRMIIRNGAGNSIDLTSVDVDGCGTAITGWTNPIADGDTADVTVTCASALTGKFKGDVTIAYMKTGRTISQTATGSISGTVA